MPRAGTVHALYYCRGILPYLLLLLVVVCLLVVVRVGCYHDPHLLVWWRSVFSCYHHHHHHHHRGCYNSNHRLVTKTRVDQRPDGIVAAVVPTLGTESSLLRRGCGCCCGDCGTANAMDWW